MVNLYPSSPSLRVTSSKENPLTILVSTFPSPLMSDLILLLLLSFVSFTSFLILSKSIRQPLLLNKWFETSQCYRSIEVDE